MSWMRLGIISSIIVVLYISYRTYVHYKHVIAIEWCKQLDQEIEELLGFGFSESDSVVKRLRQMQKEQVWCRSTQRQNSAGYLHDLKHMQTIILHDMQHTVFEFHHLNVPNDHKQLNFMRSQISDESAKLNDIIQLTQTSYIKRLDGLKIQYKQAIAYYKNELRAYLMHGYEISNEHMALLRRKLSGKVKGYYRYVRWRNAFG